MTRAEAEKISKDAAQVIVDTAYNNNMPASEFRKLWQAHENACRALINGYTEDGEVIE